MCQVQHSERATIAFKTHFIDFCKSTREICEYNSYILGTPFNISGDDDNGI